MKGTTFLLWQALLGLTCGSPTVKDKSRNVTYEGINRSKAEIFLGIPYGEDTGGENRFKPPRPFNPSAGTTIKAQSAGPACPQRLGDVLAPLYLSNITEISEDCLHLNVYRPMETKPSAGLPVMLFIHGGSFIGSSKDEVLIQPEGLILQSIANKHPVLFVTINYRLGAFGFAQSKALEREGSENAGLRDQRLAIEWVRDNIAAFGGNPKHITILGQSSGGLAVGIQILAYGGTRPVPFQQAVCESQVLEPGITGEFTKMAMKRLVDAVGCNTTDLQSQETVACLRDLSLHKLLHAQTETYGSGPAQNIGDLWLPVVDGDFIPAPPSELINSKRFADVTSIFGWCDGDANPFADTSIKTEADTSGFFAAYLPGMSASNRKKLLSLYPVSDFQANPLADLSAQFYRSTRILRDILFTCQTFLYGQALTEKGNNVFLYDQNQTVLTPILDSVGLPGLGVVHTSEFAYVFSNLSHYNVDDFPNDPNETDFRLSTRESRSWSTFASLGHPSLPGHDTLKGWTPAFSKHGEVDVYVIGGSHEGLSPIAGPGAAFAVEQQKLKERCGFLNSPEIVKGQQY